MAGRNLLDGLDSMSFITKQSVNGPVWALLALDSHDYPVSGDVTREKLVRAILDTSGRTAAGLSSPPPRSPMWI